MNRHKSLSGGSLIERATEIYDFSAALRGRAAPAVEIPAGEPVVEIAQPAPAAVETSVPGHRAPDWTGPVQPIDRLKSGL